MQSSSVVFEEVLKFREKTTTTKSGEAHEHKT